MIRKYISAGLASAAVAGVMLALPVSAFAGERLHCRRSSCEVKYDPCKKDCCGGVSVVQHNDNTVTNSVVAVAETGGNKITKTVKGTNSITTGDATVTVTIDNTVGVNILSIN